MKSGENAMFSNDKKKWVKAKFYFQDLAYYYFATSKGNYKYCRYGNNISKA